MPTAPLPTLKTPSRAASAFLLSGSHTAEGHVRKSYDAGLPVPMHGQTHCQPPMLLSPYCSYDLGILKKQHWSYDSGIELQITPLIGHVKRPAPLQLDTPLGDSFVVLGKLLSQCV